MTDHPPPRHPPWLIVILGPPGSGKTTLARALAPRLGACLLNSDDITQPFFGDDRDSEAYRQLRPTLYRALYRLAETNLALGLSVVVDAPHGAVLNDRAWHDAVADTARRHGAAARFLRCACPPDVMRQRMQARGEARDRLKLDTWETFLASQPDWSRPAFDHQVIDTSLGPEVAVAWVLAAWGRG